MNEEIEFCTRKETILIVASTLAVYALNSALWVYVGHWISKQGA